jgi:hypothetical protein
MAGSFAEPWPCPVSGPLLMETVEPGASLSTLPRAGLVCCWRLPLFGPSRFLSDPQPGTNTGLHEEISCDRCRLASFMLCRHLH